MAFHLFHINELFSNADGSIQFIELVGDADGQRFLQGHTLTATQGGTTHSFAFPSNLPSSSTLGASVLIATQGFANTSTVMPDYIVPAGFLFTNGSGIVNFAEGSDVLVYSALPTDGKNSLNDDGSTGPASPTNFAGDSVIPGTVGADNIGGGAGNDTIQGGGGNDSLDGGSGNDVLGGGTGDDTLNGGLGIDRMSGGAGNDIYIANNSSDVVTENANEGTDHVRAGGARYTLGANVEHLTLTGNASNGTGNNLNNVITGNSVINALAGGGGNDSLDGGAGNDTLSGGSGNDTLNGGLGIDQMSGGGGNDIYVANNSFDIATENANGGTDHVLAGGAHYTLGTNVEYLTLTGSGGNGTGNTLGNEITGSSANNLLNGAAGNDTLSGSAGDDTLLGGSGSDSLMGGTGNDSLDGGAGADTLNGGTGADTLNGAAGADQLTGGSASDTFVFRRGEAHGDALIDFDGQGAAAGDRLLFVGYGSGDTFTQIDATHWSINSQGGTVQEVITVANGASFDSSDYTFAGTVADIDLSTLDRSQGFRIFGANAHDSSGYSVSSAGDVNGDGFDDLIIGSPDADGFRDAQHEVGGSYVIFGRSGGFTDIDLATLTASQGFRIFGADDHDYSGESVSSAGDVNGDGFDDLMIGAPHADSIGNDWYEAGESYVIFGRSGGFADIDLATLGAGQGFRIFGVDDYDYSGASVSSAGDVNGDGFDDLVIGAPHADSIGNDWHDAGESYVIFGRSGGFANIDLAALDAGQGFRIFGVDDHDYSGSSVASAGDVNGDGFDDLIIGAPHADSVGNDWHDAGESYVVFGKGVGFADVDLALLTESQGFSIFGVSDHDYSGASVASAGDVNGDGFDDLIIGAPDGDGFGNAQHDGGDSYVIFGKSGRFADVDLALLTASQGFRIFGADNHDFSGTSVSSAGDVNGDGFDDLIVGAFEADASGNAKESAGESYVIFGRAAGLADIDLGRLTPSQGFRIFGAGAYDHSGRSVSAAGDVNGDGFDDLIVGAYLADSSGNARFGAGESYVIFGADFRADVTFAGTAGANAFTGTAAAEIFVGGRGNDTMTGNGGADVFQGGAGNDAIQVANTSFRHADGGAGSDVLRLMGGGLTLDLIAAANNKASGIETIDLTGSGNNALRLRLSDVLDLSDSSNDVFVNGNAGDSVVVGGPGWTHTGNETHDGIQYTHLVNGAASLLIEQGIVTNFI